MFCCCKNLAALNCFFCSWVVAVTAGVAAGVLRAEKEAVGKPPGVGEDADFPKLKAPPVVPNGPPNTLVPLPELSVPSVVPLGGLNNNPPLKALFPPKTGVASDLSPRLNVLLLLLSTGMEGNGNFSAPVPNVGGFTPLEDGEGGLKVSRKALPFDVACPSHCMYAIRRSPCVSKVPMPWSAQRTRSLCATTSACALLLS